jgi:hypothetical protein
MKRKNINRLVLAAGIISYILLGLTILAGIVLIFNIFGVSDLYDKIMLEMGASISDIESEKVMMYINLVLTSLMNLYFAKYYIRNYKFGVYGGKQAESMIRMGLVQMILVSFIPGLLGLIAGVVMNGKKSEVKETVVTQNIGISDLKMAAMKEAATRLRELRDKGAISEEEYYASLNKILEG